MGADGMTWAEFVGAWELFREPVLTGVVGGAVLGFLGAYIVLERMVFVSAAVTQVAALGVASAFYVEIHHGTHVEPVYMAVAMSTLMMLLLVGDPQRFRLTRESLLGLVFATAGGATLLIEARISQEAHDIHSILFGDAVLVRPFDYHMIVGVGAAILVTHLWLQRGIAFAVFDPLTARVQGLPVRALNAFVLISIGVMVGVTARALGALPVFAFSTLPAIGALALGMRLPWTLLLAAALGGAAGGGGYLYATFRDFPVGGSQTAVAAALTVAIIGAAAVMRLAARFGRARRGNGAGRSGGDAAST